MAHDYRRNGEEPADDRTTADFPANLPGKRTLVEDHFERGGTATPAPVQRKTAEPSTEGDVHDAARRGIADGGSRLPHFDLVQRSFGAQDVSNVHPYTGEPAARASGESGAQAYATGRVAPGISGKPSLAAHDAPAGPAPGKTTRSALAPAGPVPEVAPASGPPAPAHAKAELEDKAPKDLSGGLLNHAATLNWDKPAKLYGIEGGDETLRSIYERNLRSKLNDDPLMRELGLQALLLREIGPRIERIENESEPLWVGGVEKKGPEAGRAYRQALWRCSQRAIIATLSTSTSSRYQKKPGTTYCNVYSADMVNAMGGYLPRVWYAEDLDAKTKVPRKDLEKNKKVELSANLIGSWLLKWGADYGWRQVDDPQKAQYAANAGKVVIIQASKANAATSGHVNVIIAEGAGHKAQTTSAGLQPLQSQAGESNYAYSDTTDSANSDNWWKAPEDGGAKGDPMKKTPGGNFWIYEGAHQDTAVASASGMGGTFQ